MPGPYRVAKGKRVLAGRYMVAVEGVVCFQHPARVNVENTCNFYLIIIV